MRRVGVLDNGCTEIVLLLISKLRKIAIKSSAALGLEALIGQDDADPRIYVLSIGTLLRANMAFDAELRFLVLESRSMELLLTKRAL